MAESIAIKDGEGERRSFSGRAVGVFVGITALFLVLFARMVQLQVVEHSEYQSRSENNRIHVKPVAPRRGSIFDRNGILLADNRPIFSAYITTELVVGNLGATLDAVRSLVSISEDQLGFFEKRLRRKRHPFEPVLLKANLSAGEEAIVAVNRHRLPGVDVRAETVRDYPLGDLTAHAVGSVRRIDEDDLRRLDSSIYAATSVVGRRGVELFYERSLHGEPGYKRVEVDARGRERETLFEFPPVAGQNITLHLDAELQQAASEALGDRRGAVVAIDPKSGGVLAMVSHPAYDPNEFVTGIEPTRYRALTDRRDTPLFNRAIQGRYPPGSTFKPIVGLAGISLGLVDWEDTVEDRGWFRLKNQQRIYRDWSWTPDNAGGQGIVDLHRAIYRSSNVYFYSLASQMEIDDLVGFASQFGYGRVTSIDVAEAAAGLLPDRVWKRGAKGEVWYPGDTVNVSIGQGDLLVTPLQLATVATLIANRGRWVRPRMLLSSDKSLEEFDPPPPLPPVTGLEDEDWEKIVGALEAVVHRGNMGYRQNGTAWAHIGMDVPYRMAGKSGTVQVVEIGQGEEYDEETLDEYQRKHAWFMAFAPVDDPVIALSVLIENGGGGSSIAGPVAREILDAHLIGRPDGPFAQVSRTR